MLRSTQCYGGVALAVLMLVALPQAAALPPGPETLDIVPAEVCVTDPGGEVEVAIEISGILPVHAITGVTFNVEWDPNSCWQLCDPHDVEPVDPFEQLGEDTGPGYARFSA